METARFLVCRDLFTRDPAQQLCACVCERGFRNEDDFNEAWQIASVGMLAAPEGDP